MRNSTGTQYQNRPLRGLFANLKTKRRLLYEMPSIRLWCSWDARVPVSKEFERMNKAVIISLAILGLSTSAAFAKAHHAKKPGATSAATMPVPTQLFVVSDADKKLYAKNKRDSGVK